MHGVHLCIREHGLVQRSWISDDPGNISTHVPDIGDGQSGTAIAWYGVLLDWKVQLEVARPARANLRDN